MSSYFTVLVILSPFASLANASQWPGGSRGSRGVNIHWSDWSFKNPFPPVGLDDLASYADIARTSMDWAGTEREQGVYNWTYQDTLMEELYGKRNVTALLILGLWNPAYCRQTNPPTLCSPTEQWQVDAFAKWAVAGVGRYRQRHPGSNFIVEIWNEPNIQFWRNASGLPAPNVTQYASLALATASALKAAFPEQLIVGPCAAGMPIDFFEEFGQAGGFNPDLFDGASFHPYRASPPENMPHSYDEFAAVVAKYTPEGRNPIPLVTSEQGWTTCGTEGPGHGTCFPSGQLTTHWQQASYVPRRYLIDEWYGVPASIDYEFRDGGNNVTQREQMYGKVTHDVLPGGDGFAPKASFLGVQAYSKLARGAGVALEGRLRGVQAVGDWQGAGTNAWVFRFGREDKGAGREEEGGPVGLLMGWVTGDNGRCSAVPQSERRNCGNMPSGEASKETCEQVLGCCFDGAAAVSAAGAFQCFFPEERDGLAAKVNPLGAAVPSWGQWKQQQQMGYEGGANVAASAATGPSCWQPIDWMGTPVGRAVCSGSDGMLGVTLGANVTYFARTS